MFPEQLHKSVYLGALILLVISLPFSVFTLSVALITLMVNWILEGKFKHKWEMAKERPSLWIMMMIYAVHLLWMANTSDYSWGLHDLKIKLPLLTIPLVIGTSETLDISKIKAILHFYIAALFVATIICAYHIFRTHVTSINSGNDYFSYVSHIRLSLMVVMAIFIVPWLFAKEQFKFRWLYIPLCIWFIVSLAFLQVLTGVVIFITTTSILLMWTVFQHQNLMLRWFLVVIFFTLITLTSFYLTHAYARFYAFDNIDISSLPIVTSNGNPYWHNPNSKSIENGHYVNLCICELEMRKAWNVRSKLMYDSNTFNGGQVKQCLVRYLTSKGLTKDSLGVHQLTSREIRYIETGTANYIDTVKYGLYPRIYVALWELYNYKNGANPTGYSISQRLEFLKTGFHIIQRNKWFGVGTGDIPDAFAKQYDLDKSPLAKGSRLRTHNQWITFLITFGIIGFLLTVCSLLFPPFLERKYSNYLFLAIFTIGFLSFLNEDTLETHQGVTFFAFFYTLFIFYKEDDQTT